MEKVLSADNHSHQLSDEGRRATRRVVFFAYVFLILSTGSMLLYGLGSLHFWYRVNEAQKDKPLSMTYHVRVGGLDYDIPQMYFREGKPRIEIDAVYVEYLYPEYIPLTRERRENFERIPGGDMYAVRVSANDFRGRASMQKMADLKLSPLPGMRTVPSDEIYGLSSYKQQDIETGTYVPFDFHEPFILYEQGVPKTVLGCWEEKKGKIPICSHYFTDGTLMYELTYRRTFLPDWKDIESKTAALFADWHAKAIDKKYSDIVIGPQQMSPRMREYYQELNAGN